jgi:hypothetical protein
MFERFDDPDAAAEFSDLSAEEYAERQGIEIVASNPNRRIRGGYPTTSTRERNNVVMASKTELEDTVRDIYDVVQESGSTRAEMSDSLNQVATLCTEALPELEDAGSEGETDDEEEES